MSSVRGGSGRGGLRVLYPPGPDPRPRPRARGGGGGGGRGGGGGWGGGAGGGAWRGDSGDKFLTSTVAARVKKNRQIR